MQAAFAGRLEVVKFLLAGNANVNPKDKNGESALDFAIQQNYTTIAKLLNS